MKRFLLGLAALISSVLGAYAQPAPGIIPGCVYNSSAPTLANRQSIALQCDVNGRLKVATTGGGDVVGPASATDGAAAAFDGITGKLLKDSKVILTVPASAATLTLGSGKTVTISNTLTFAGTDATTMTFPSTSQSIPGLALNNIFTRGQTITQGTVNESIFTSTGYSLTGSNAQSMIDLAGTLNTSGNPVLFRIAATDTASGATTKFVSFLGGASATTEFFSVDKGGIVLAGPAGNGSAAAPTYAFGVDFDTGMYRAAANIIGFSSAGGASVGISGSGIVVSSGNSIGFSATSSITAAADTILARDAANTLAQRNGTTAQTLRVYGTWTNASNGDWLNITKAAGGTATIATVANGTGTAGDIVFTANADSWTFASGGTSTFPNTITLSGTGNINVPGAADFIWNGRSRIDSAANGNIRLINNAQSDFGLLQLGGTTSSFPALKRSTTTIQVRLADDSADAGLTAASISTSTAATFHTTTAALTDGAGASSGTITNAPSIGNPTKWIGINDNGTTRYIPAW